MEVLIEILTIALFATLMGFTSAMLGKTLDGWMGYNDIFDFVRKNAARKKYIGDFEEDLFKALDGDINENTQAFSDFMWEIANQDKRFMIWMCVDCMSTRIFLLLFAILVIFSTAHSGMNLNDLILLPSIFLMGMSFRKYFL